jgi:photosystem II stability/assembly factor-like uncharacterized protein
MPLAATAQATDDCAGDAILEGTHRQITDNGEGVVYTVGAGGYYSSCDGGITWAFHQLPNSPAGLSVFVDPSDSSRVYVGTNEGINVSASMAGGVYSFSALQDGTLLAANSNGLFSSTDRGNNWDLWANSPWEGPPADENDPNPDTWWESIRTVHVNPANDLDILISAETGESLRSTDGGQTWGEIYDLVSVVNDFEVDPVNPSVLFAASAEGIMQSADAGTSWIRIARANVDDIAFDPGNPTLVYSVSRSDGIARSNDGGQSWVLSNTNLGADPGTVRSVHVLPGGRVLVGTDYAGLYFSDDSGASWTFAEPGASAEPPADDPSTEDPPAEGPPAEETPKEARLSVTLRFKNNSNGQVSAGNKARYEITIHNHGPDPSTNTRADVRWYESGFFGDLNPGHKVTWADGTCCNFGTLAPGESITLDFSGNTKSGEDGNYYIQVDATNDESGTISVYDKIFASDGVNCLLIFCEVEKKSSGGGSAGLPLLLVLGGLCVRRRLQRNAAGGPATLVSVTSPGRSRRRRNPTAGSGRSGCPSPGRRGVAPRRG